MPSLVPLIAAADAALPGAFWVVPRTALSRRTNIVVLDHFTDAGAQRGWGWETASVRHIDLRHWAYRARVLSILMGAGQYDTCVSRLSETAVAASRCLRVGWPPSCSCRA